MSAPPRLVASDLDGTLLGSDGTVSIRTRAALERVRAAGATLVLVTGRPPRWMRSIAEQTGHAGVALVANGAGVLDLQSERLLARWELSPQVAAEVAERVRRAVPDARIAGETGELFLAEEDYPTRPGNSDVRVVPRAQVLAQPLLKLLVRTPSYDPDALLAAARAVVDDDLATLTHSSREGLLEISAAGVTKGSGLARLARQTGIAREQVVAFGDMPNDLPMLAWAGRSYAVANAHPHVLAAAGSITASNDDDGVARVLEALFGPAGGRDAAVLSAST